MQAGGLEIKNFWRLVKLAQDMLSSMDYRDDYGTIGHGKAAGRIFEFADIRIRGYSNSKISDGDSNVKWIQTLNDIKLDDY